MNIWLATGVIKLQGSVREKCVQAGKRPWCPKCGASEEHPEDDDKVLIRGYKVDNYSQCLVCSGYYNSETLQPAPEKHDPNKGWF